MRIPTRVFVTGACGFIGRALMNRFAELGSAVSGVDLAADPTRDVVAGDVGAPGDWQQHVEGSQLVIHTAAVVSNNAPSTTCSTASSPPACRTTAAGIFSTSPTVAMCPAGSSSPTTTGGWGAGDRR